MLEHNPSQSDDAPTNSPGDGVTLLCEGAMRTEFGRQPSQALSKALAELAKTEERDVEVRESVRESRLGLLALICSWLRPHWQWVAAPAALIAVVALLGWSIFLQSREFPILVAGDHVVVSRAGQRVTLAAGNRLRAGTTLTTEVSGSASLRYSGETTTIDLSSNTVLTVMSPGDGKKFTLAQGRVEISAAHQPDGKPMRLIAPQGEAKVVGTRFALDACIASTWLEVQQGTVQLLPTNPIAGSVSVGSGQYAVAADGVELTARQMDFAPNERPMLPLRLDLATGKTSGDGLWSRNGDLVTQRHVSLHPWTGRPEFSPGGRFFPISEYGVAFSNQSSLQIQGTIVIDRTLVEAAPGRDLSGRIGLRIFEGTHALDFLLNAESRGNFQVFAWTAMSREANWKSSVIGGGPGPQFGRGTYQFKLRIDRHRDGSALLRGKIWIGSDEPNYWPVQAEVPQFGAISQFSFDCMHCAATFRDFKAWLIE